MTSNISPLPIQHFIDNFGNALNGGKLFTYAAGTTTKLATYTDSTGATANTNPVVLNVRGEANVWLTPGLAYKFVLSPSTDSDPPVAPFWTVDNITNPGISNVATIAALRSMTASPTIVWVQGYASTYDGGEGFFTLGPAGTDNGGTIIVTGGGTYYRETNGGPYSWRWFGAKGVGTDDTTAILACNLAAATASSILAVPQEVICTAGNFGLSQTMPIGNGTSSAASTIPGIVIRGSGTPSQPAFFTGQTKAAPTTVTWLGGAAAMVAVNGPVQGWGLENMLLNGASTATIGISVVSGQFGRCKSLCINNCTTSHIGSNTVALFSGVDNCDSLHNHYENIFIQMPTVANVMGIVLTGDPATNSDTDANVFDNIFIAMPGSGVCYGLYLQNCDGNQFRNILISAGSAASISVLFDYTACVGGVFPSGTCFYGIDTNGFTAGANQWLNAGTPGVNARPHTLRGLYQDNGATQPNLANFIPDVPAVMSPSIQLTGQTASIAPANLVTTFEAGIYRISGYLAETAAGNSVTVTASISWFDPSGAQRVFSTAAINLSTGNNNPQSFSQTVACIANEPIGYLTTVSGAVGSGTYSLAIVVERLS